MAAPTFTNVEKRATLSSFLHRQIFNTPTLPRNVDLTDKTVIVTGSNTGIGLECARQLLNLGLTKLIIAVRDQSKGERAKPVLSSGRSPHNVTIEVWDLDLQSYDSITSFVDRAKNLERLDIVVLNAGISKQFFDLTPSTGHEETIQVNVISTVLLAILLLPIFKAKIWPGRPGRLVIVSSDTASWARFKKKSSPPLLPALDKPENFTNTDRYATSKLLGQLMVAELTKRTPSSVAIVTMPNPGWCYGTGLGHVPGGTWGDRIVSVPRRILGRHPSVGARVLTDAAVQHGAEAHGQYLEDCEIQPLAPLAYTSEGTRISEMLWQEIMRELSFAKVDNVLQELGK
ncbi:retinol dehydrogenase 12 [Xylariaceae sp. FL1019]|nr:retinol dehydrogenase 12 [Xylariaceae sp. FL1019]